MRIRLAKWNTIIGVLLLILSIIDFIYDGMCTIFIRKLPFGDAIQGQANISEWFLIIYMLEPLFLFVTGISLLKQYKSSFVLSMTAIVYTYLVAVIWFAVGAWPMQTETIISEGSGSTQSLMFGNRMLFDGDGGGEIQIYTDKWLLTTCILTLIFASLSFACIRYFRRKTAQRTDDPASA